MSDTEEGFEDATADDPGENEAPADEGEGGEEEPPAEPDALPESEEPEQAGDATESDAEPKRKKFQVRAGFGLSSKSQSWSTSLPVVPNEPKPYRPIFYTFRVANCTHVDFAQARTKTLPFYLQLDNTIAVIWAIFSPKETRTVGINQLQWALIFLKTIRNKDGSYAKDIDLCIKTVEDFIIDLYADLVAKLGDIRELKKYKAAVHKSFSINYDEMKEKLPKDILDKVNDDFDGFSIGSVNADTLISNLEDLKLKRIQELSTIENMIENIQRKTTCGC